MRFLVDESTGPRAARWLQEQGHDVLSVYDSMRGAKDREIISLAFSDNRILITNDRDFGDLIYRQAYPHKGVILLRLEDERSDNKIKALEKLLQAFSGRLENQFAVVTETMVRFSKQ
jgi:predicted nuclease of predicted toxin-antitoxin system